MLTFTTMVRYLTLLPFCLAIANASPQDDKSNLTLPFQEWLKDAHQQSYSQPELFLKQAFLYLEELENSKSSDVYTAYHVISDSFVAAGNYQESRKYLDKALAYTNPELQPEQFVETLFSMGLGYFDERNHSKAYEQFGSALRHTKKHELLCWEFRIKAEIGSILIDVGDYIHAKETLESISKDNGCANFSYEIILAGLLANMGDYEPAFELFDNYIATSSERDSLLYITEIKAQYAIFLVKAGQIEKAQEVMKDVAHAIETVGVPNPTRLYEWSLANLLAAKNEPSKALEYALTALSDDVPVPRNFRLKIDHEALPLIINLYAESAQLDKARQMMERLLENNAQYFADNRVALLGIAEARLNLAGRDGEISLLNQQAQVGKLKFERLLLVSAFLVLAALVFAAWIIALYRKNLEKQRFNRVLEENIEILDSRAKGAEFKLAHKETLFQESHHRLKNNLHFLVSILEIQRSRLNSDTASRISNVLLDVANRIQAMAVIHHFSHTVEEGTASLSIDELFKNLVEQTYTANDDSINIQIDCEDVELDNEVSKSLILIVNELLCNAQKHAFEGDGGEINVMLSKGESSKNRLIVEDNGKGFSGNPFETRGMSMGLKLVKSMVEQISGLLTVDSGSSGTRWTIDF